MKEDRGSDYLRFMCLVGSVALTGSSKFEKFKELFETEESKKELKVCNSNDPDVRKIAKCMPAFIKVAEKVHKEIKTILESSEVPKIHRED